MAPLLHWPCGSGDLYSGPSATCVCCAWHISTTGSIRVFQVGYGMETPLHRSSSRNEGSSLSGYGTAFDVGGSPQISTATARSRGVHFHPPCLDSTDKAIDLRLLRYICCLQHWMQRYEQAMCAWCQAGPQNMLQLGALSARTATLRAV